MFVFSAIVRVSTLCSPDPDPGYVPPDPEPAHHTEIGAEFPHPHWDRNIGKLCVSFCSCAHDVAEYGPASQRLSSLDQRQRQFRVLLRRR